MRRGIAIFGGAWPAVADIVLNDHGALVISALWIFIAIFTSNREGNHRP